MLTYLQRLRITTKLWLMIVIFTLVGVADNLSELALISQRLHAEKEVQLKQVVETAHAVLHAYERRARDGSLSPELARQQAAEAIRQLRYGELEYFWIHDLSQPVPRMVMHPTVPSLEGQVLVDARFERATSMRSGKGGYQTLSGSNLFVAMNQAIEPSGEGFVTYDWPKPLAGGGVSEQPLPKLSYVKRFDAWGWVVGSGIYIDDLDAIYWKDVQIRLVKALLWILLLCALMWFIIRTVVQPLQAFQATIDRLRSQSNQVLDVPTSQPGELGQLANSFARLVDDLRRSRNELTLSIDKLRTTARSFANMKEGILITDADGRILSLNPAFTRLSGFEPEDLIGQTPALLRSQSHDPDFYGAMWRQLKNTGQWTGMVSNRTKNGIVMAQWVTIMAARDRHGQVRCYVGLYWDAGEDAPAPISRSS